VLRICFEFRIYDPISDYWPFFSINIDNNGCIMYEIKIIRTFSAAHRLKGYPGNCRNVHGHNWKVEVIVETEELDSIGMAVDFRSLRKETDSLLQTLEHTFLNEISPFDKINPTAENIARWIFVTLSQRINDSHGKVSRVVVWENDNSSASYFEKTWHG